MSMTDAVASALTADPIADTDQAVAALARLYAETIDDDPGQIKDLGPKLLAALEALQLSPRARALARVHALTGKVTTDAERPSTGDELGAIRARRHGKRNA